MTRCKVNFMNGPQYGRIVETRFRGWRYPNMLDSTPPKAEAYRVWFDGETHPSDQWYSADMVTVLRHDVAIAGMIERTLQGGEHGTRYVWPDANIVLEVPPYYQWFGIMPEVEPLVSEWLDVKAITAKLEQNAHVETARAWVREWMERLAIYEQDEYGY